MKHANDNLPAQGEPLRFLSVCSGIEAASVAWHELGWQAVAFSEIEKFPSAVLAHHYPDVPNLGDMTKFKEWPDFDIDVLCGGTPCQSFSVAGLRQGLADPRGNLTLTFLGIAEKYQPKFICWENVPGILSDKTGALASLLDGLEELGYVVDIDILDAQFFGLAQRRRRIIVCGQSIKHILESRTISSVLTIAQCLQETLQSTLDVLTTPSTSAHQGLISSETKTFSSLKRKMKLFGLQRGAPASTSVENLAATLALFEAEQNGLDLVHGKHLGEIRSKSFVDTKSLGSNVVTAVFPGELVSTETSWQRMLAAPLQTMSECITSTSSSVTTDSKIYSCAQLSLFIARHIHQSMDSSPVFWSAAQSSLTALKEFTNYARQAGNDLFGDMERLHAWGDFVQQAEPTIQALGNLGVESFGEILPLTESVQRNSPPSREARKDIAPTISARTKGGGGLGTDFDLDGGVIEATYAPEIARCVATREGSSQDYETTTMVAVDVAPTMRAGGNSTGGDRPYGTDVDTCDSLAVVSVTGDIAHTLKAEGADASEDGTGRGTPIIAFSAKDYGADASADLSPTLRAGGFTGSHANGGVMPAIAFGGQMPVPQVDVELSQTLQAKNPQAAFTGSAVRRPTPTECERLQGFPDNYTNIPWRGKPTSPDGPRYKALGNSWAVPKFTWLGRRIAMHMPAQVAKKDAA